MWAKILKRVPNSVLWLYKHPTMAVLRLLREARRLGVDASRLVFAGPVMPKTEHLKRLTLADVYLDTLVYNGHTTGSDVLWAGVPMVTIQVSHQLHPALPCAGSSGSDADVKYTQCL